MAEDERRQPITPPAESHGTSVAAWTAVTIVALGFLLLAIAWVRGGTALYLSGAGLIVVGAATGKVLAMLGFGAASGHGSAPSGGSDRAQG